MTPEPLVVVGIGADGPAGLSPEALDHVRRAETLAGGKRHLAMFPDNAVRRIVIDADLAGLMGRLQEAHRQGKTVVLASGDPLFFGIGRALLEAFNRDDLVFLPQVGSVPLAFARIKETWHDARVVSLHGRPLATLLPVLREGADKIAVLTDARNDPAAIARLLVENGFGDDFVLWVCEELGGPGERVTRWQPRDLTTADFSPLNVVVLLRRAVGAASRAAPETPAVRLGSPDLHGAHAGGTPALRHERLPLLGIPESALAHRAEGRGLITKREVRLIALCRLELHPGDVFWDVGAGSGSVAMEAARLSPDLRVFAIERSAQACRQLQENLRTLDLERIQLVHREAPEALTGLPAPDAVFVGGSGGRLTDILEVAVDQLRAGGRLVLNCITLETLARGWDWLHSRGLNPEATSVQLAHSRPLGSLHALEPDSPIFILQARKR
jgi:precorrin-6Y C5,15-methyltransferase (decarboxylating)